MTTDGSQPGRIITFYSYKGGVGRSFALSNVAAILSRWGARVLCVDWDLEAPGLHHFFPDSVAHPPRAGLMQLLESAASGDSAVERAATSSDNSGPLPWKSCVYPAKIGQTDKTIDVIAAGRGADDYVRRVHDLDWQALYERHALGEYLERLRQEWTREYDFVLLDSRTGLTDIGGICTIHLPDIVVSVFTANHQSMEGTAYMAERINEQRRDFFYSSGKALIMPLLSRWEERDAPDDAKQWLPKVLETLRPSYDSWRSKEATVERLAELLKIPYKAKWNFGERLAVLEESATDPGSVSYHLHLIAATLARDFRATDLLASEPERFVRLAAEEAPRKRQPPSAPNRNGGKMGLLASCRGDEAIDDSDAAIAADVRDFLRVALESTGKRAKTSAGSSLQASADPSPDDDPWTWADNPGGSSQAGTSAFGAFEHELRVKLERLLEQNAPESDAVALVRQLNTLRGAIGRGLFQALTSSAAKELLATLVNTSTRKQS